MKKLLFFLTLALFSSYFSYSQQAVLKGTVIDTTEKKNLTNSVVSLLRKSDSLLLTFTRSDAAGNFTLKKFPSGKYLLMVTHPTYADFMEEIEISDSMPADLVKVMLTTKSQLLQEVIIRQQLGAIRFKKDTIEYVADSFRVEPNASVEDLLKKLPGLTVNSKGEDELVDASGNVAVNI